MSDTHVDLVAHHWLLLAGPAFLPAIIVVAVVLYVAIKDRRTPDDGHKSPTTDATDKNRD